MLQFNRSILLGVTVLFLLSACGGGGSSNDDGDDVPAATDPNTILNGSFETGDYTSWLLSDSAGPEAGIFANLEAGVAIPIAPPGNLFDHQDGIDVSTANCLPTADAFPVSIVSDGLRAGLHAQSGPSRHTMTQDVFVESNAASLRWDMAYDSAAGLNGATQYIALNIIDPVSLAVLATPFKLDPLTDPQELATFTTFAVDVSPYRGQTIRIELELQIIDNCLTVFFDNFRISTILPPVNRSFTTCNAAGAAGPDQAACDADYAATNLAGEVTVAGGKQQWTVPFSGTYTISVAGAGHTTGSALQMAAVMTGDFDLSEGDVLDILVGQMATGISSGGGGTFVEHDSRGLLIAAGGSGGICSALQIFPEVQASDTITAQSGNTGSGGTAGNGGQSGCATSAFGGGAGGGFLTDGEDNDTIYGCPGFSFMNGGAGGTNACGDQTSSDGGFGGGGAGFLFCEPGGGGGYSGGGGGGAANTCGGSSDRVGGGGGSFNSGANTTSDLTHKGHGYVTITLK